MTALAPFVRIVARGKGRARALSFEEAHDAMRLILSGTAEPEAVGGLLMVLRLRGEVPDEIAGFTAALRAHAVSQLPAADLDWPSYAAGRSRGAPLYLLAARLVAQAGYRVSVHGATAKRDLDCPSVIFDEAPNLHYAELSVLAPAAAGLLDLRATFGLRSCINTVLRMWNPSGAAASVQGVFHPSYRGLQSVAAARLGQRRLSVIKGGGGEFERHPGKDIAVFGLRDGQEVAETAPALRGETRRLSDAGNPVDLTALWTGDRHDEFARATITGTAALALWTLGAAPDLARSQSMAEALWRDRHTSRRLSA